MMSYKKACRLCLKELQGPGVDCLNIDEMRETIQALFEVNIQPTDITTSICNICFEKSMNFKAYKKTVSECQSIIKEYETIRKKVLQRQTSIKEETIDLCENETKETPTTSKKKTKRPTPTDSEINDILDIVHENNDRSRAQKNGNKESTPLQILKIKSEKTLPDPVQSPDSGNASTRTSRVESSSGIASNENPPNKENEPEKRRSSNCSISTSGIPGILEDAVKTEYETTISNINVPLAVHAVSSSIQSPEKNQRKPEREAVASTSRTLQSPQTSTSSESGENNNLNNDMSSKANDESQHEESEDEILLKSSKSSRVIVKMNIVDKEGSSNVETDQPSTSSANRSNNISKSYVSSTNFTCPNCSSKYKSQKDLNSHIKEHIEQIKTAGPKRGRAKKRHSEPNPPTVRRSARIAQSQTLQNLFRSEKKRRRRNSNTSSASKTSTELPNSIAKLKFNQERVGITHASSSVSSEPSSSSSPYLGFQSGRTTRNSKRIITITLLRSKDSVNFRYCDQYKNIIDFESVTTEELCDIRSSLMSPSIWNNLTDVFKTSTPDDETIKQLKTIFGQGFRWS